MKEQRTKNQEPITKNKEQRTKNQDKKYNRNLTQFCLESWFLNQKTIPGAKTKNIIGILLNSVLNLGF